MKFLQRCYPLFGFGNLQGLPTSTTFIYINWDYLLNLGVEALPAVRSIPVTTEADLSDEFIRKARQAEWRLSNQLELEISDWRGWTVLRMRLDE